MTVGPGAEIGTDARIGECVVIGRGAVVGARVHLPPAALVADGAAVEASADSQSSVCSRSQGVIAAL